MYFKEERLIMVTWNNLDTVGAYKELEGVAKVNLADVMSGENGAARVRNYSVPMAEGMVFNYASRPVDDAVLAALAKLAEETQLTEKNPAKQKVFSNAPALPQKNSGFSGE